MENYSPRCEIPAQGSDSPKYSHQVIIQVPAELGFPGQSLLKERRFFNEACYLSVENSKLWTINTVTKAGSSISSEIVMSSGKAALLIRYDSKQLGNKHLPMRCVDRRLSELQGQFGIITIKRKDGKQCQRPEEQREILSWFVLIKYRRKIICA